MTTSKLDIRAAAAVLDAVATTRKPAKIFTAGRPEMTMAEGYAVQRAWSGLRAARGDKCVGYKVGLTSRAMQMQLKVDAPQYGRLHEAHRFTDRSRIQVAAFLKPRVEVELAFIMKADLKGPGIGNAEVLAATQCVQPALEIVDYRTEVPRAVPDMISDNTAAAGFILGGRPTKPDAVDLKWIAAVCSKNGVVEETGVTSGILGHPAASVAVLANKLAEESLHLKAGDIVLAGSVTRQIEVAAGDHLIADYGPLGSIEIFWQ